MVRPFRALALGGVVSCVTWIGLAGGAENTWFESEDDSTPTAAPSVSPVKKRPASAPQRASVVDELEPRNYYQELFSDSEADIPAQEEPVEKIAPKPSPAPAKAKVTTANKAPKKPVPVAAPKRTRIMPAADPATAEKDWAAEEKPDVVKAVYDEDKSSQPAGRIQQVKIETRPKIPRVPVLPARARTASTAPLMEALDSEALAHSTATTHAAPVSGPQASAVTLEWVKKSEINVGQECVVELVVKNSGSLPAQQVRVDAVFQSPVRLISAKPQAIEHKDRLSWNVSDLSPGSEQRIALKLVPNRRGDLGLEAQVHLTSSAAVAFRVEEPLLKLALKGPAKVMLGESASQMVTVSNPGTGAAHDVKIATKVSRGLELSRGQGEASEMEIGTLMPGESRTVRLPLTGVKGGSQTVAVVASASSDVSSAAETSVTVISPSLSISADGPALRYKGRNAKFTLQAANDGPVANNNVRVVQRIGEGFEFVSADHGGKYDPATKTVAWFLGRLEAEQKIEVSCELTAAELGDFTQAVHVASDAGARAETSIETKVEGAASLTMEVVDLNDPVEVGVETAYEIRIKNGGSKAATNVAVSCELPHGVQLLSAKGPTDATAERHTLKFKPVAELAPGQESTFRVHVKGVQEGNLRIKARVSSDSLSEPLLLEEQTKFYSDARR